MERLRDFDAARAAFVRAVAEYNERLLYEKKIGEWPPRIGDLYERMEDAKRDWFKVAEKLADDTKGTEAATALTTLQQQLAAERAAYARLRISAHLYADSQMRESARATAAEAECAKLKGLLDVALETLDNYAAPEGYTNDNGEEYGPGAEVHPGLLAKETAANLRTALAAKSAGGRDAL